MAARKHNGSIIGKGLSICIVTASERLRQWQIWVPGPGSDALYCNKAYKSKLKAGEGIDAMINANYSRALIFSGGNLGGWALSRIRPDDYLIGADRGALFLARQGRAPHLAVGDFDSISENELDLVRSAAAETLAFDAVDKDWTDTELAVRETIARGFRDIVVIGGLGTRFDHSLANVHLLNAAAEAGCRAILVDEHNEIRLLAAGITERLEADSQYPYVSLLPLTPAVTGITLQGFKYPLTDATITIGMSLGVSNELAEPCGSIRIGSGKLLVVRSRD
jgi:thiamine pyrophosphokinase